MYASSIISTRGKTQNGYWVKSPGLDGPFSSADYFVGPRGVKLHGAPRTIMTLQTTNGELSWPRECLKKNLEELGNNESIAEANKTFYSSVGTFTNLKTDGRRGT